MASEHGPAPGAGTCRSCGCTDDAACLGGCAWFDVSRTICDQCAASCAVCLGLVEVGDQELRGSRGERFVQIVAEDGTIDAVIHLACVPSSSVLAGVARRPIDDVALERARNVVMRLGPAFCRTRAAQDVCATCQAAIHVLADTFRTEMPDVR